MFLKQRCIGETLGEDNIVEIRFKDLNKDVPVEPARYIRNHVVEVSRIKGPLDSWTVKVLKGPTIPSRGLYHNLDNDRGCILKMDRR